MQGHLVFDTEDPVVSATESQTELWFLAGNQALVESAYAAEEVGAHHRDAPTRRHLPRRS